MDLQEHHELTCGEEFCFPATTTYYPPLYGFCVPGQLYQHHTISSCNNRAPNYTGHQAQGTPCMYSVIPEYVIANSPHGPHPLHPCAIGDGRFVQDYHAETVEHKYHQPVSRPRYAALPSMEDRMPAATAQSHGNTNSLFVPGGLQQTVAVASESGVAWNQSVQQATVSSMELQGHTFLPKEQPCRPQFSGGAMEPARLPHARQGHQAQGTSGMYYVVPEYGIAHSPQGPHPLHPCAIGDGRFVRTQEHRFETVEHKYGQPVSTPHYAALPSMTDRIPATTTESLANTNGLFVPGGLQKTVAVASENGVAWNQSVQQATVSSTDFQGHTFLPKKQPCMLDPWKQQFSAGVMLPARLPCARQASQQSPQVSDPSVLSSLQTNLPYNNEVPTVGSDHCKALSAERSQPSGRISGNSNRRSSSMNQRNISKAKMPIGSMSSEIIVKSYTSRLDVGNSEGSMVIRTNEYNKDDFQVSYPSAKFFVIKPINEADVHKSIKYGVWSTSLTGNKKLDSAFREAQVIAASSCTLCPVFLFFSVNGSSSFYGVAEMVGPVNFHEDMDFWSKDMWIGSFPVKWHIIKDICNFTLRSMMLQNNENKPVTSKDPLEVDYICGTSMLEIFKSTRAEKCLFDKFMVHDDEEARNLQKRRFKLWRGAQHFVRARPAYSTPGSVLMYRAITETNNLTDMVHLNLEGQEAQTSATQGEF